MGVIVDVVGFCPACGRKTLHVIQGVGMIHCLNKDCPHKLAAHKILNEPEVHHILEVLPDVETEQTGRWTLMHPLIERVNGDLFSCPLHESLQSVFLFHNLPEAGRYRIVMNDDSNPGPLWEIEAL